MSSHSHSHSEIPLGSREHLRDVLDHAAHYLPTQGPIGVFVHHNTLHAFQHQEFESSVIEAANLFKAEPFLSEETYQSDRARGRILEDDIDDVLAREPDAEIIPGKLTCRQLRRALLIPGVRRVNGLDIAWQIEEGNWLESFRSDLPPAASHLLTGDTPRELWDACKARVPLHSAPPPTKPKRPREVVLAAKGIDLDLIVNPPLIRLVGAYLDQGIAYWPMPLREEGLMAASRKIMSQPGSIARKHLTLAGKEFSRQAKKNMSAEDIVADALERLAVVPSEWDDFITAELIALPGWAGMIRMLENDVSLAPHDRVRCSLMEFLALRFTYMLAALQDLMEDTTTWRSVSITPPKVEALTPVARFFDVAQLTGLSSGLLSSMPEEIFQCLTHEIAVCNEIERRRLLHLAYERRHERSILIPLAKHRALPHAQPQTDRLAAQIVFCIDEREESIRRALEEVDPCIETVGAAGFFGVAIDYP